MGIASKVRGLIIAYGVGAYALIQHNAPQAGTAPPGQGALVLIGVGLAFQGVRLLVLWLVGRHERAHGIEGALSPTASHILDLGTDAVTVLLFALATFRSITSPLGDL